MKLKTMRKWFMIFIVCYLSVGLYIYQVVDQHAATIHNNDNDDNNNNDNQQDDEKNLVLKKNDIIRNNQIVNDDPDILSQMGDNNNNNNNAKDDYFLPKRQKLKPFFPHHQEQQSRRKQSTFDHVTNGREILQHMNNNNMDKSFLRSNNNGKNAAVVDLKPIQEVTSDKESITKRHEEMLKQREEKREKFLDNKKNYAQKRDELLLQRNALLKHPNAVGVSERMKGAPKNSDLHHRWMVFVHIGKNGGTSFDRLGPQVATASNRSYIGNKHFDWTYVDTLQSKINQQLLINSHTTNSNSTLDNNKYKIENDLYSNTPPGLDVVVMLRHPVKRAISHFYFSKGLRWTKSLPFAHQNLTEYLLDKMSLLQTRDVWQDGQAAVSWLTSTHIASWVGIPKSQVSQRELIASNYTKMCHLAAYTLEHKVRWFGILEQISKSMELLQVTFNLTTLPEFPHSNTGRQNKKNDKPTQWELDAIESLVPQDLWLYQYATKLFEARYNHFVLKQPYISPEYPPLPDTWSCSSTRYNVTCNTGPLVKILDKQAHVGIPIKEMDEELHQKEVKAGALARNEAK